MKLSILTPRRWVTPFRERERESPLERFSKETTSKDDPSSREIFINETFSRDYLS